MDRIAVMVVGKPKSGKSTTWNYLFGRAVSTGKYERYLRLTVDEIVKVFLINGSPEERNKNVKDIIVGDPQIILCSVQYAPEGLGTLDYLAARGYLHPDHLCCVRE